MADIIFNPVAGVPFSGGIRYQDCGDGTFAPLAVGIGGALPVLSLNAQSALNTVGAVLNNAGVRNNHSLVVTTSAGVTAGAVQLQGSQDNVNWGAVGTAQSVTAANTTYINAAASFIPLRYVRAIISTGITGGTISAWVASA